jgi:hypothetical protein
MKKILSVTFLCLSLGLFAQDTLKTKSTKATVDSAHAVVRKPYTACNELGGNFTLFLKQIFDLSNTTLPTLPYDLTYKHICGKNAFRAGFGILMNNSTVNTTTTSSGAGSGSSLIPGPDPIVPTTTKSMNIFYRLGWERRYMLDTRICAWWGLDLAGQIGSSHSASSVVNNNLPNSYSYSRTSDDAQTMAIGGGPVCGIQFYITQKLSFFTEMPLYFQYNYQKDVTDNYQNQLIGGGFNPSYASSDNGQTQITKNPRLSLTLPVTLYLALKF